jgi:hypothetical protein
MSKLILVPHKNGQASVKFHYDDASSLIGQFKPHGMQNETLMRRISLIATEMRELIPST